MFLVIVLWVVFFVGDSCVKAESDGNLFKVPVLLLIFNRPDVQQKVFDQIRQIRPTKCFIAADGPRVGVPEDQEKCMHARKIIEQIDWPCEVQTLFRDKNLGCDAAVSEAITWFFDNVEEGIILEDDCVPSKTFFHYCQLMLERYRYEERVWNVLGTNYYGDEGTYFFSTVFLPTGWASWRRAWQHFDPFFVLNRPIKELKKLEYQFLPYLRYMKKKAKKGLVEQWDHSWAFAAALDEKLSVCPPVNMVDHSLGHGPEATHCKSIEVFDLRRLARAYDCDLFLFEKPISLRPKYKYWPNFFVQQYELVDVGSAQ